MQLLSDNPFFRHSILLHSIVASLNVWTLLCSRSCTQTSHQLSVINETQLRRRKLAMMERQDYQVSVLAALLLDSGVGGVSLTMGIMTWSRWLSSLLQGFMIGLTGGLKTVLVSPPPPPPSPPPLNFSVIAPSCTSASCWRAPRRLLFSARRRWYSSSSYVCASSSSSVMK